MKYALQIAHQFRHARLGLGRKTLLHVKLAQRLADVPVENMGGAFPARLLLQLSA